MQPQTSDLASEKNKTEIPNTLHALAGEALVASAALPVAFLNASTAGLFHICHHRWALGYDALLCLTLACFGDPQF